MDAAAPSSEQHGTPAYTTSKQVQAWFLRRSRDLWKNKYAALKVELKRFRQRVADLDRSRRQLQYHAVEVPDCGPEQARRQINGPVERILAWQRRGR